VRDIQRTEGTAAVHCTTRMVYCRKSMRPGQHLCDGGEEEMGQRIGASSCASICKSVAAPPNTMIGGCAGKISRFVSRPTSEK